MVFLGGGEPDSIVSSARRLVPQNQNNFLLHIDGKAAEHGPRVWRQ